jgi:hypothetical protein
VKTWGLAVGRNASAFASEGNNYYNAEQGVQGIAPDQAESHLEALTSAQMTELKDAVMESSDIVELNLKGTSAQNKELAISFARQFDTMDEQTSKAILEFLKRKQVGEKE